MCDDAANRHAREIIEQREYSVPNRTADIFEVNVDPLGASFFQLRCHIRRAVIDCRIEAELLHDVFALLFAACDTDSARALDLRDLPDRRADRTCRRSHDNSFIWFRLADG